MENLAPHGVWCGSRKLRHDQRACHARPVDGFPSLAVVLVSPSGLGGAAVAEARRDVALLDCLPPLSLPKRLGRVEIHHIDIRSRPQSRIELDSRGAHHDVERHAFAFSKAAAIQASTSASRYTTRRPSLPHFGPRPVALSHRIVAGDFLVRARPLRCSGGLSSWQNPSRKILVCQGADGRR